MGGGHAGRAARPTRLERVHRASEAWLMICSNVEDVDPVPSAERRKERQSNGNRRFNRRVRVVVSEGEIFEAEIVDAFHVGIVRFGARSPSQRSSASLTCCICSGDRVPNLRTKYLGGTG